MSKLRKIVVLLGPTASGKSALGVKLAKKFHGIVISADSRQVYRGMDVGTAKITSHEMQGVPHYLLNVASPKKQYSVARYVQDVHRVLKKISFDQPVFLVGGTPFYIKAVTEPGSFSPVPPNPTLRRRLQRVSTPTLLAQLRRLDSIRAKTIDPANRRRIIRALEIARTQSISTPAEWLPRRVLKIGLRVARPVLYHRIDNRTARRLSAIIAEVKKLHRQGLSWKRLESFGLEYRFGSLAAQKKMTTQEAAERINFGSHDFVRRQLTWWRKEPDIHWVTSGQRAERLVRDFLIQSPLRRKPSRG